jgi:hypothetical protein
VLQLEWYLTVTAYSKHSQLTVGNLGRFFARGARKPGAIAATFRDTGRRTTWDRGQEESRKKEGAGTGAAALIDILSGNMMDQHVLVAPGCPRAAVCNTVRRP